MNIFSLDMSQMCSNLLKKAFATWQHTFLSTSTVFYDILLRHAEKSKFEIFWMKKWPTSLGFSCLLFFSTFPFSPFVIFLWHWLTFYWSCFRLENVQLTIIKTGNFYHGAAKCSHRKFFFETSLKFLSIFTHISGFIEPITLIWVSLERSFSPAECEYRLCPFWSKVMTLEVNKG